jgi:hypothetical protein
MSSSSTALDRTEVDSLLADLCIGHGFCLPSQEHDGLVANPPQEVLAFVDAVFITEGLNPETVNKVASQTSARAALSSTVRLRS